MALPSKLPLNRENADYAINLEVPYFPPNSYVAIQGGPWVTQQPLRSGLWSNMFGACGPNQINKYYLSISLSIYRSISLSIYIYIFLYIYISISIYLFIYLSYVSIYIYLSNLSIFTYLSISIFLSIYLSIYLSI